jgi:hypothetical protein
VTADGGFTAEFLGAIITVNAAPPPPPKPTAVNHPPTFLKSPESNLVMLTTSAGINS